MDDFDTLTRDFDRLDSGIADPDIARLRRRGTAMRRRRRLAVGAASVAAAAVVAVPAGLAIQGLGSDTADEPAAPATAAGATTTQARAKPTVSGPEVGTFLASVVRRHLGDTIRVGTPEPLDRYMDWPTKANNPVRWRSVYQWMLTLDTDAALVTRWHLYPVPGQASPGFSCDDLADASADSTCRIVPVEGGSVRVADYRFTASMGGDGWVRRNVIFSDADFSFEVSGSDAVRADSVAKAQSMFELSEEELVDLVTDPDLRLPEVGVLPPNEQASGNDGCDGPCGGS